MQNIQFVNRFLIIGFICWLVSCTKMDAYKKYAPGGEMIYAGIPDSVKALPGKKRILVKWLLISDPSVSSAKVFWNAKKDSQEVFIKKTAGIDTIKVLVNNLAEGTYTFDIYTFDKAGNTSVKVSTMGIAYGETYQNSLLARAIKTAAYTNKKAVINWNDADTTSLGVELKYTDTNNVIKTTLISNTETITTLTDYKSRSKFEYRTLFKPEKIAIDTFYTSWLQKGVTEDVTGVYLKNAGNPFVASAMNGTRWGNLADWTVTDPVKNHGGYGGFDNTASGTISMEYWGTPAIENGKIFQTVLLPAGTYKFSATVQNIDYTLDSVYVVAAAANALPDVSAYSTGLGYVKLTTNAMNGTTQTVTFKLNAEKIVSLGFIGTLKSSTQGVRIKGVTLIYIPD